MTEENEVQDKNTEIEPNIEVVSKKERSFLQKAGLVILDFIKMAILAGITIGLVRYFLFKPFYVKGESMEPNYLEKDYLIIDELTYRFRAPERGEVIVLKAPNGGGDYYLKRVIGLPGERVKISDSKIIVYNEANPQGILLDETYLHEPTQGSVIQNLGPEEYFVLGDNRDASYDSRRFGPVKKTEIIGRAWLRGWPIGRITKFNVPDYKL